MRVVLFGPREEVIADDPDLEYREKAVRTYEELLDTGLTFSKDYTSSREFLGIECLAAVLRQEGHEVWVLACGNEGLDATQAVHRICSLKPDVLGVSLLYDIQFLNGLLVARHVKRERPDTHVLFGGPLASMIPELLLETFSFIDSVITGEAERSILQFVHALEAGQGFSEVGSLVWRSQDGPADGKLRKNPPCDLVDLDSLPFASRDVIASMCERDLPIASAYIYTSRGCEAYCTFCTVPKLVRRETKWRFRDPKLVVDEMESIIENYGVSTFYMADDNFLGYGDASRERLLALADEIVRRKIKISFHAECRVDSLDVEVLTRLRQAGFDQLLLGLESGSDKTLHRWAKGQTVAQNVEAIRVAQEFRFDLVPSVIVLDWESTTEEVEQTVSFIEQTRVYECTYPLSLVNKLKVHCGTSAGRRYENVHGRPRTPEIRDDESLVEWIKAVTYQGTPIDNPYVEAFWKPLNRQTTRWSVLSGEVMPQLLLQARKSRTPEALAFVRGCGRWRKGIGPMLVDLMRLLIDEVRAAEAAGRPAPYLEDRAERFVRERELEYFKQGLEGVLKSQQFAGGDAARVAVDQALA